MGHKCCSKQKVKRGLWSPEEDEKLINHITTHGYGSWSSIPKLSGLQRCGKSCRLRWINYLKPDVKRGSFTAEEEQIIIDVHRILGNRWAQIAKHLPGRTDNEVKNFWNSCIKKKLLSQGLDPKTHNLIPQHKRPNYSSNNNSNINLQPFTVTTVTSNDPPVMEVTTSPHELLKLANPSNVPWTGNSTTQVYQQPTVENGDRVGENNKVWSVHNNINIESFEVARVADIMKPNAQEKDIYDEHDNNNNNKSHGLEMDALFDLEFMESTLLCGENLMISSMDDLAWNF